MYWLYFHYSFTREFESKPETSSHSPPIWALLLLSSVMLVSLHFSFHVPSPFLFSDSGEVAPAGLSVFKWNLTVLKQSYQAFRNWSFTVDHIISVRQQFRRLVVLIWLHNLPWHPDGSFSSMILAARLRRCVGPQQRQEMAAWPFLCEKITRLLIIRREIGILYFNKAFDSLPQYSIQGRMIQSEWEKNQTYTKLFGLLGSAGWV